MTGKLKWIACGLGMLFVPFLILTAYLIVAGKASSRSEWGDLLSLVLATFGGMAFLIPLPLRFAKITVAVFYFFVMGALLTAYGFNFVCGYYHECL